MKNKLPERVTTESRNHGHDGINDYANNLRSFFLVHNNIYNEEYS